MGTKHFMRSGCVRLFSDLYSRRTAVGIKHPYTVNHWKEIEQSDSSPPTISTPFSAVP